MCVWVGWGLLTWLTLNVLKHIHTYTYACTHTHTLVVYVCTGAFFFLRRHALVLA